MKFHNVKIFMYSTYVFAQAHQQRLHVRFWRHVRMRGREVSKPRFGVSFYVRDNICDVVQDIPHRPGFKLEAKFKEAVRGGRFLDFLCYFDDRWPVGRTIRTSNSV
jgi:hypothetical protein